MIIISITTIICHHHPHHYDHHHYIYTVIIIFIITVNIFSIITTIVDTLTQKTSWRVFLLFCLIIDGKLTKAPMEMKWTMVTTGRSAAIADMFLCLTTDKHGHSVASPFFSTWPPRLSPQSGSDLLSWLAIYTTVDTVLPLLYERKRK